MSGTMSTATSVALMDVRRAPYVLTLPKTTDIPYRVVTVKDIYGKASFLSTITVLTQSPDVFEDGTTSKVFTNPNEITQLLAGQPGRWYTIGGTSLSAVSYNTLSSGIINAYTVCTQQLFVSSLRGDGSQLQNLAGVSTAAVFTSNTSNFFSTAIVSTVAGLGSAGYISSSQLVSSLANFRSGTSTFSTLTVAELGSFSSVITGLFSGSSLTVSSINGATVGGPLFSTVIGLGSAGYISSSQLLSSLANFQSGTSTFSTITVAQTGNFSSIITGLFSGSSLTVSSINGATVGGPLFSTVIGLGSAGYVSTANLVGLVSTANLVNLVSTNNLLGLVSTQNLLGLVSTPNLLNLVSTNNLLGLVSTPNLLNLVSTQNLLGLVSTPNLVNLVSTQNLLGLVSTPNLVNLVSTNNLLGLVSTPNLVNLVSTNNLLNLVSTRNLLNLVSTQNLLGLVSTPNLVNLVSTNNLLGLVSTPNLLNLVSTQNLLGLVSTPNLVNLVSTNNLLGLVSTQNLLNLVSTQNLQNLVSTPHLYTMLQSTVAGLGSINYISSAQLLSTTSGFQTYLSSQIGLAGNNYYGAVLYLNHSLTTAPYKTLDTTTTGASATTLTNTVAAGTSQAISQFQTDDTMTPFIPNGIWNLALFADSTNPNTYLYMSLFARSGGVETLIATTTTTPTDLYGPVAAITEYPISLAVPYTQTPPGTTVVLKIFASNADSTSATVRTYYEGNTYSFLRTTFGTIIPADSLTSTVAGLGNASYLSSSQLISTVVGLGTATYISSSQLLSTVAGLGSAGYVSTANLVGLVSTPNLLNLVSTNNLLGLVSTPNLVNLVSTNNLLNLVSTQNLLGLVSTPNLVNLVSTNNLLNLVSTQNLLGLVSTPNLVNLVSTQNLLNLVSTQNLLNLVSTQNLLNLVSTQNLLGIVSTPNLVNLVSTNNLLNLVSTQNLLNLVSTNYLGTQMQSTVMGLATVGYVSSTQLLSSLSNANISSMRVTGIANISTLNVSSVSSAFFYALQGSISSLQVNALTIGTGTGVITLGDIITTSISSISTTTNILFASTATIQSISSLQMVASSFRGDGSQLQNVAGLSTVALFTSNTSNYARGILQDWSTPVSTVALFTSNTSNYAKGILVDWSTPVSTVALFTSNTSNYAKGILQDWSTPVSTVAFFTSNTSNYAMNILQDWSTATQSTVIGLGSAGYISTGQFQSSMLGITSNISSMIDPIELASSIIGLGTIGFVSSIGLTNIMNSTVIGLNTYIAAAIDPIELTSSIVGLGTMGFISSIGFDAKFGSTLQGLGTAGYISSSQLYSTVTGITVNISTRTLSAGTATISSVSVQYITGVQGYISSLVVDSLAIGSNSGFINMGDIITTSISSLQINTGIFTASGVVSTPQLIISSINGQTIAQPIQSTAIGLATLGYISSSQLFSTVTALTGSTLSLSAGSIFVSSLQGFRISTAQAMVCTVTFQDQLAGNPMGNIYQYSSILYYNSYVVAGTTAMNIQSFTF
jgi:hypothetical protein